jgi:hypothetical protein
MIFKNRKLCRKILFPKMEIRREKESVAWGAPSDRSLISGARGQVLLFDPTNHGVQFCGKLRVLLFLHPFCFNVLKILFGEKNGNLYLYTCSEESRNGCSHLINRQCVLSLGNCISKIIKVSYELGWRQSYMKIVILNKIYNFVFFFFFSSEPS